MKRIPIALLSVSVSAVFGGCTRTDAPVLSESASRPAPPRSAPFRARAAGEIRVAGESGDEPGGEADHADEHHDGAEVHLDPSLLRDLRITTARVDAKAIAESVTALGEVVVAEPSRGEVASPVLARVVSAPHLTGDRVAPGEVLAVLASVEVGRARAELHAARARRDYAARVARQKGVLALDGAVATKEKDAAQADALLAHAEAKAAEETLHALGAEDGEGPEFSVRAPIGGAIFEKKVVVGGFIEAGATLFALGDPNALWLIAHTFERDAVRVKVGAEARLQFVARPGKHLVGKVLAIGPRVDPVSRTLDVRVAIDDPDHLVRPGMTATAALPIGDDATPVLAVPLRAVQRVGEAWVVFVPGDEAGSFAIHAIGRGRDLGDHVEILSGISPGTTIVVDGAFLLKAQAAKASGGGHHDH